MTDEQEALVTEIMGRAKALAEMIREAERAGLQVEVEVEAADIACVGQPPRRGLGTLAVSIGPPPRRAFF